MKTLQFIFLNLTLLSYSLMGGDKAPDFSSNGLSNASLILRYSNTHDRFQERILTFNDMPVQLNDRNQAVFIDIDAIRYRNMLIGGIAVGAVCIAIAAFFKYCSTRPKTTTINEMPETEKQKQIEENNKNRQAITTLSNANQQLLNTFNQQLIKQNNELGLRIQELQKTISEALARPQMFVLPVSQQSAIPTTTSSSSLYNGGPSNKNNG
jgi:hypothetical protein